jgi:hypothetical protein
MHYLLLIPLAFCAYIQNMAFTWSSRSRNSGDPAYHRRAALASNSIWFVTHVFVWGQIWASLNSRDWRLLAATGAVYVACTTEGSVRMMRILLAREKGKRRVGAQADAPPPGPGLPRKA